MLSIAEVLSSLSNMGGLYGWRQCCLPCFALPELASQALLQLQTLSDSEHTNGYCCFDLLNLGSSVTLYIAVYPYANPIRARVYTIGAFWKAESRTSKKTPQWREGRKLGKKKTQNKGKSPTVLSRNLLPHFLYSVNEAICPQSLWPKTYESVILSHTQHPTRRQSSRL